MKLTHAPIVVSNQDKALKFFTEVLGFEKRADYQQPGKPRWLTVAPKGEELELILVQGKSKVDLRLGPEAGTGGHHIAFRTTDCRKDFKVLKARGVNFSVGSYTEPLKQEWGTSAVFKDPDGNQFALVQPTIIGEVSPRSAISMDEGEPRSGMENDIMIEKITHVPIVVSDQDQALRFYTEVLGFEKRQDYQQEGRARWLTVAPKGQEVECILIKGKYTLDPRPPSKAESSGNHWAFSTNDCREDFAVLKARGVKFKDPAPVEAPYGISAYFTDPDGNHFALLQPAQAANADWAKTTATA